MKTNTKEKAIKQLLDRGVEKIYPSKKKLLSLLKQGKRLKLYCGYDPSSPTLHVGHLITINKLAQFQQLGHEVIFLIGDFTGMIGDPTDKQSTRSKLTRDQVLKNCRNYQKQISKVLAFEGKNKAVVKYNSQWNDKLSFVDLIELSSNFTVGQMIQRDMFQQRIQQGKPIHLHEFLYPLAQAYDSLVMDVDLEIGGNDQMFNMMCGRDLIKALKNKEKFVLTTKLLADEQGKKMGKSEGNAVSMTAQAKDIYGKIMSWTDGLILPGFELLTQIDLAEVAKIKKQLEQGQNPMVFKKRLAFEITKLIKGKAKAVQAEKYFEKVFSQKQDPENLEVRILKDLGLGKVKNATLINLINGLKKNTSKSQNKRLIRQGAVKVNNKTINDPAYLIKLNNNKNPTIIKIGKREFYQIKNSE
ncbi:MAG: tyrosine--tRNA ligase [Candidatus Moranbacteria bacterium]|nr:tyrosine--tRNA ligase [Candidatus Moranbacteria bacterium]